MNEFVTEQAEIYTGLDISLTQEYILAVLDGEPLTDTEIKEAYRSFRYSPRITGQALRVARKRLVEKGMIWQAGRKRGSNGYTSALWERKPL